MQEFVEPFAKIVVGYVMVVTGWLYNQVSESVGGVIDRGFDAGLSIGLLIVGLIVLGWYHYKYQQHNRKVIDDLVNEKDKKAGEYHALVVQQNILHQQQIQTNKDLQEAVNRLSERIDRMN